MPRILSNNPTRRSMSWAGFRRVTSQARRSIRTLGKDDPNTITGDRELILAPGTAATLTTAFAGADNDITFTSSQKDAGANAIRVAFVNPGGTAARSIVVAGNDITINLAVTAGVIDGTETATSIVAAVNADAAAARLVAAVVAAGNSGAGVVAAMALTNLAGGAVTFTDQQGTGAGLASRVRSVLGREEDRIVRGSRPDVDTIPDRSANNSLTKR